MIVSLDRLTDPEIRRALDRGKDYLPEDIEIVERGDGNKRRRGGQPRPVAQTFAAKTTDRPPDACWVWQGKRSSAGYGVIERVVGPARKRRVLIASRVSYELHVGRIPDGLWVLHACDNPPCVNPSHLFLGTVTDNVRDMFAKGRGRPGYLFGEKHPWARLTNDQVATVRRSPTSRTLDEWAAYLSVSKATVSRIINGKTWRRVLP